MSQATYTIIFGSLWGLVIALATGIFYFLWADRKYQKVLLERVLKILEGHQERIDLIEEVCLPIHLRDEHVGELLLKKVRERRERMRDSG